MPNRFQQFFSTLKSRFNDVLFGADLSPGYTGRSGRRHWLPGTTTDWEALTGDLWQVPGVMACYDWEKRSFDMAPPQVMTQTSTEEWQAVPNHPLIELLRNPNSEYDGSTLRAGVLLSYKMDGNAYIGIERSTRHGLPTELWYIPHYMIRPRRDKDTGGIFYEYLWRGQRQRIPYEDIIHIRNGFDPRNPLCGLSPLSMAYRSGYLLQQGINYGAKAMKNAGILGALATPDAGVAGGIGEPFDTEQFVSLWSDKTTGERAGEIMAIDFPLKLQYPNVTPQNMAMDTMLDRPESDICALYGVPAQVVGLHVGRLSKTYANVQEAREIAWEECLLPDGNTIYGQIGSQLLRQLRSEAQARRERCCLDISRVRPLQPDLDALYLRANAVWQLNLIDRHDWSLMVNRVPNAGDKGLFYQDVIQSSTVQPDRGGNEQ